MSALITAAFAILLPVAVIERAWAASAPDTWLQHVEEDSARRYGPTFGPPCVLLTNLPTQSDAGLDDACRLVATRVLGSETNRIRLSALRQPSSEKTPRITTWGRREITAPWPEYWFFFADDDPQANWAHPCRYIFVARDLSAIAVQRAMTPPNNALETAIRYQPPAMEEAVPAPPSRRQGIPHRDGSVSNCYAVIISGGHNTNDNATRYWGDAAFLYSTLTLTYSYPKTNIYTYISDGTNPAVDATDLSAANYINSPIDLDNDGLTDTLGEANTANISNAFLHLRNLLQPTDQLLVFVTDHGNHTAGGALCDSELNLWGDEVIRDVDLEAWTTPIACPILFVLEQCFSGGFLDNLDQPHRAVATAAPCDGTSSGGETFYFYDQWCYHWIAAMRGFYPVTNAPWLNTETCDGDLNGDGYVSFREASHFANINAPDGDTPLYADHPDHLGSRLFLMQPTNPLPPVTDWVELEPFKTPPATNVPWLARISARDQHGFVATNFAGPVTLGVEADIVNPGVTVGHYDSEFSFIFRTDRLAGRTQVIFPAGMIGSSRTFDRLSLMIVEFTTQTLHHFTIRMRHTPLDVYPMYPTQVVWEADYWTTVHQQDIDITTNGWQTFVFTNTFVFDGVQNLMTDFSFSNEVAATSPTIAIGYDGITTYRSLQRFGDGELDDPLTWSGTNPAPGRTYIYPYIQFGPLPYRPRMALLPTNATDFTGGVWTGQMIALNAADNVRIFLTTTNTYWDTIVDRFPIREYLFDLSAPHFDPGGDSVLSWGSGTGFTYRIMRSTNLTLGFESIATNLLSTPPLNMYTSEWDSAIPAVFRVEEE